MIPYKLVKVEEEKESVAGIVLKVVAVIAGLSAVALAVYFVMTKYQEKICAICQGCDCDEDYDDYDDDDLVMTNEGECCCGGDCTCEDECNCAEGDCDCGCDAE